MMGGSRKHFVIWLTCTICAKQLQQAARLCEALHTDCTRAYPPNP